MTVRELAQRAKDASKTLMVSSAEEKNRALMAIAQALRRETEGILAANREDLEAAEASGISPVMLDRLALTEDRVEGIAQGVEQVVALPDPVGEEVSSMTRPNGLLIRCVRVPLGVVGMIYESRPNVTVDAAVLCLKAGNAAVLRGGKEAIRSNRALADCMRRALLSSGLKEDCICLIEDTARSSATELMGLRGLVDVLIPRGGAGLIRTVVDTAKVPVIETGVGNCHIYVDGGADLPMAARIVFNAKCSRPSVCNAAESLLVSRAVAEEFLPLVKEQLDHKHVELRGCPETRKILGECVIPATEADYAAEFLDYVLSVKVVSDVREAVEHIGRYTTGHSEAIVTEDAAAARYFTDHVDAAAVYVNCSTRFTDGGEFGLGAEIGISTQKMHARGPMGLTALTSTKYVITGHGQIR